MCIDPEGRVQWSVPDQGGSLRPGDEVVVLPGGARTRVARVDTAARTEHTVTETLIRSMYAYWRRVMEV